MVECCPQEALEHAQFAASCGGGDWSAYVWMGDAYVQLGSEYDELAEAAYGRADAFKPADPDVPLRLGKLRWMTGRQADALAAWRDACSRKSDSSACDLVNVGWTPADPVSWRRGFGPRSLPQCARTGVRIDCSRARTTR
jgi:hypothetical protein